MSESKTNAMRILEQHHIPYQVHTYPHEKEAVDGVTVAALLRQDPACVYKTLVARGKHGYFVFDIPVTAELDLKKAACAVGEKSITLVPVKELLPLTGYVRGGCSPIGMKKQFPTVFHALAETLPVIMVSGGKIGLQIACAPKQLLDFLHAKTADLIKDETIALLLDKQQK